jgi:predicted ATPase
MSKVGEAIVSEHGSEVHLLEQLIPDLPTRSILSFTRRKSRILTENFNYDGGQERRMYAFRVLTRIFSSHFSPLVLAFDDLQWADISSLQVIDFLISDTLTLDLLS